MTPRAAYHESYGVSESLFDIVEKSVSLANSVVTSEICLEGMSRSPLGLGPAMFFGGPKWREPRQAAVAGTAELPVPERQI